MPHESILSVVQYGTVTREERQVAEGVKALRATLNESQQQFSNRLGVSISTVARYELQNPPQGAILIKLGAIAHEAGREDLRDLFQKAFEASIDRRSPIAEAIRSLRATAGESQQEFAQRAGLSVVSVARYETDARPKKAVLARLAEVARDLGRADLQTVFQEAQASEAAEPEIEQSALSGLHQMATPEGVGFLKRISEKRLKRIRKLFLKEFHSERELSAMCAAAWLLEHYSYYNERDDILVDEIKRVLDRRGAPLTLAELDMLGKLGRRAVADKVQKLPISQLVRGLREHLDLSEETLAKLLQTTVATVEEFEAGTRAPGIQHLEIMLFLMRMTTRRLPELELAFSLALDEASEREESQRRQEPMGDLGDEANERGGE